MNRSRAFRAPIVALTVVAVAIAVAVGLRTRGSHHRTAAPPTSSTVPPTVPLAPLPRDAPAALRLREVQLFQLVHPVADPAAATVGNDVLYAAGLDSADASTAHIGAVNARGARLLGSLAVAYHDAGAAALDGALYTFGGGDGAAQLATIRRITPNGTSVTAGALPAPASDAAAATIGHTAYVVGGYTGARWLDTIVAYTPGRATHVVGHLPVAVRYAAVAAVGDRIVIAGGVTPIASATSAVYVFEPASGRVTRIADLPVPLSHAAAATLGDRAIVAGGRNGSGLLSSILAIDPVGHTVRSVGTLAVARSDAGLVRGGNRLYLIGGKTPAGTSDLVSALVPAAPPAVDVYRDDGADALTGAARHARPLVYVPNSESNTVDVIDPQTYKVVEHFPVGALPQHVTPSWDLSTLYVDNDRGNSLTPLDPRTGQRKGPDIAVDDPYNLYFTTDGRFAIVVAEARHRLDFRNARTMQLVRSVPVPCVGVDHMDFTADGRVALVSCEFSGQMLVVDVRRAQVLGSIDLPSRGAVAKPQDVKLSPDGTTFYVADMASGGVWELNARTFAVEHFLATGAGAHGLYVSRDSRDLYVTNRSAGTISVVDFRSRRIVTTWRIPGSSPDMGGVSADGRVLWLSGRYGSAVYAISTHDGHLIATIPVGRGPHGLCVWPQPGRYSIGHTGIMR